ncbi:FAD dependent oxidoreductase [Tothia fuscella]|uniref:FAD dependent oxidoreductase n=1 Tax=Tothia fuscella TaxID=1048955 RepID=A0A9P4NG91_9PEZI|nr:FAD dependent oxidoreductase [Tothia fuscella]
MSEKKNIIVIGGGIIGSCSAYFLSRHPKFNPSTHCITLLEATKIAGGASGKAGGLLALWAYPSSIVPLSYRLHKELAEEHGGAENWGYRGVHCGQIDAKARPLGGPSVKGVRDRPTDEKDGGPISVSLKKRSKDAMALLRSKGVPADLDWVDGSSVSGYEEMGTPATTAQVHPYLFTTSMAWLAEEKGVKIIYGAVTSINTGTDGVESVSYTTKEDDTSQILQASQVVLSAGPWTQTIWPEAPISALRAHSVTIRPSHPVSPYCLFTGIKLPKDFYNRSGSTNRSNKGTSQLVTPEIYARPNNEVYACGEGDELIPLPKTSDLVEVDQQRCQDIVDYVSSISDELRDGEVTARQACYLPNVDTGGGPLIGETSVKGLVIATGHTCWGIQNGPGTGKLVSEIVFDGAVTSANIKGLDPRKHGL